MDISCLLEHGLEVPWQDFASAVLAYDEYIGMISEKTEEGSGGFWMALVCQFSWTLLLCYWLRRAARHRFEIRSDLAKLFTVQSVPSDSEQLKGLAPWTSRIKGKAGGWLLCYILFVQMARPIDPYQRHASTALVTIPRDIISGFIFNSRPRLEAKVGPTSYRHENNLQFKQRLRKR